jgi:anti-sigma regulatory factor (Ser/Thr protein kinase)/L-amino acid N-acyltransferase YncA
MSVDWDRRILMQWEVTFTNDHRLLPGVRASTHELLRQLPLPSADAQALEELVHGAVRHGVDHAYAEGEEGSLQLTIREKHGRLEILVRDFGIPQDVQKLEEALHVPGTSNSTLFGCHLARLVDEVHWLAYGPEGKALQIIKWLHDTHITEQVAAETLVPFHEEPPPAPEQNYVIRRMKPEEAVQVSQLMYRAYGNSYFNADVYYPERIVAQNANGTLLSIVAQGEDGSLVGHCALERNREGPVAEGGQAVVDPTHRGRGLLNRIKEAMVQEAQQLNLVGWWADAVGVHPFTQKSNATHGGHLTSVHLGISPKTERFRNLVEDLSQRVTCLLYFHWLNPPTSRTIHVPTRHRAIVSTIYENLGCSLQFGEASQPTGDGLLVTRVDAGAGTALIRADKLGEDTILTIRHAKRTLVEQAHVEAVFVELPLADPGTPVIAEALEEEGLGFVGVAPHFSRRGDLLQLVYLVEPLPRESIKLFEDFAALLVNYTLREQQRVQAL